jgi:L-ribulose-5-phosphate 4-epimerase
MLEELKQEVWEMNSELPKQGLVTMTSGNVSGRDPETGYVVIKPSGIKFEEMRLADMIVSDSQGNVVEGDLKPSVDLGNHLYIYRHRSDINGIVHTHSNYATSFAVLGQPIRSYLTAIADEFGGEIPCSEYADNQGENIGRAILTAITRAPAVLLRNHGVFAFGPSPTAALRAAVMVEDVAKTVHLALLRGTPKELPPEEIEKWWDRYHHRYGQR